MGWIYEYALVDRTGTHDLGQLRALQDWFLRFELKTVPDVAEVASIGGMVRAWQIVLDPPGIGRPWHHRAAGGRCDSRGQRRNGGSVMEKGEADMMVRARAI